MLQAKDLRVKSQTELNDQLKNLRKELRDQSTSVINRKEKNVKKPRATRKDIARLLSILNEKEILTASAQTKNE